MKNNTFNYKDIQELECSLCFVVDKTPIIGKNTIKNDLNYRCEFCKKNDPKGEKLLERRLEIMDRGRLSRLPIILQHMYEILRPKLIEIKNDP